MNKLSIMAIPLTRDLYALVDGEDYEQLAKHKWYAIKSGKTFYAARHTSRKLGKRRQIRMHREILNIPEGMECDHRSHNGLDNRKKSLRICTHQQNQHNRRLEVGRTSQYKGVQQCNGKWRATIRINKQPIHLGYFSSEAEAAKAYDKKAKELFGEFALTNF